MDLHSALVSAKKDLVDTAFTALQRLELEHYNQAGSDVTHQRLDDLSDLESFCILGEEEGSGIVPSTGEPAIRCLVPEGVQV